MKQRVLISIDVEAPTGVNGVDNLVFCKIKDRQFGINYLMDCFDRFGFKGLFFVDIAEAWEYGFDSIINVINSIVSRGHDVGVHLHPDRMSDKDRRFLWQYSYEEQYEMIKKCTDFFIEAIGRPPFSFRAGRYGANDDTIKILESLGYSVDMSFFYGKKTCRIADAKSINGLYYNGKVLEVPVTSFKSFAFFKYKRFDKLDFSMPFSEFKRVLCRARKRNSVDVCSFFLHSFSLIKWRKNPDRPKVDKRAVRKLLKELKYISSSDYDVIREDMLFDAYNDCSTNSSAKEQFDLSKGIVPFFYFGIRAVSTIKSRFERNI